MPDLDVIAKLRELEAAVRLAVPPVNRDRYFEYMAAMDHYAPALLDFAESCWAECQAWRERHRVDGTKSSECWDALSTTMSQTNVEVTYPHSHKKPATKLERWLIRKGWRRCRHVPLVQRRWAEDDGTPMVAINCQDCGMSDCGAILA